MRCGQQRTTKAIHLTVQLSDHDAPPRKIFGHLQTRPSIVDSRRGMRVSNEGKTTLKPADARALLYDWPFWARPSQLSPEDEWRVWLLLAGRGFGKTRTGAEMIRARAMGRVAR